MRHLKIFEEVDNNIDKTETYIVNITIPQGKNKGKVKNAIKRGIIKGLDTEGNYIARPKDVKISFSDD
jgi:hypothetical protein